MISIKNRVRIFNRVLKKYNCYSSFKQKYFIHNNHGINFFKLSSNFSLGNIIRHAFPWDSFIWVKCKKDYDKIDGIIYNEMNARLYSTISTFFKK